MCEPALRTRVSPLGVVRPGLAEALECFNAVPGSTRTQYVMQIYMQRNIFHKYDIQIVLFKERYFIWENIRSAIQCLSELKTLKLFGKPSRTPPVFPAVSHLRAMLLALLSSLDWLHHSFLHEAASLQGFSHFWPWQPKDQKESKESKESSASWAVQQVATLLQCKKDSYCDAKLSKRICRLGRF